MPTLPLTRPEELLVAERIGQRCGRVLRGGIDLTLLLLQLRLQLTAEDKATSHYWFESGTSASLIEHLKHFPSFNPLDFDGVELSLEEFNVPCENASTPVPMLYQSGYLTIDYYNK